MKDIVACMITVDRRLFGKENYLGETLKNLLCSGFFDSDRLARFNLYGSRPDNDWISDLTKTRQANENAGHALEISGEYARDVDAKWVLFMEDDLDFCSDFLGSVGRYLDLINHKDRLFTDIPIPSFVPRRGIPQILSIDNFQLIAFGCPYPQVRDYYDAGRKYWLYPVSSFYGTQCFAIRSHDAISLGRYLQRNPAGRNPDEYDLMIHEWMTATYPDNKYFLASAPSFVEHIGRQSVCTNKEETHRNPSWMGRDWRFE